MAIKNSPRVRLSFKCITTTYTRKKKKTTNEMSSRYRGKSILGRFWITAVRIHLF